MSTSPSVLNTSFKGHFFGRYELKTSAYAGADFSRLCVILPGQGSAVPGMFASIIRQSPGLKRKLDQADKYVTSRKLPPVSAYCTAPETIPDKDLPLIRNLCLFTCEVGLFEHLYVQGIAPEAVTGHSFGEFAALVVTGICSFEDMLAIVFHREAASAPANALGHMIALSTSEARAREALPASEFFVSNVNSPEQVVISCSPQNLLPVRQKLKAARIAYKLLTDLPQPYHTPFLAPLAQTMEAFLSTGKGFIYSAPRIPLFSSVLKKWITAENFNPADIRRIIVEQATTPVEFPLQIEAIYEKGCKSFLEIGPTRVCSLFLKDVLKERPHKTKGVDWILGGSKSDKKKIAVLSAEKNKLFGLLSRAIAQVTGYKIEEISIEDRFQDDLGIDSIKKAEIFLNVMRDAGMTNEKAFGDQTASLSKLNTIDDVADFILNESQSRQTPTKAFAPTREKFERFGPAWKESPLPALLRARGPQAKTLVLDFGRLVREPSESLNKIDPFFRKHENERAILILDALNWKDPAPSEEAHLVHNLIEVFRRQEFENLKPESQRAIVLLRRDEPAAFLSGCSGFLVSLKREVATFFFKDIRCKGSFDREKMLAQAALEVDDPIEVNVLYEGGKRHRWDFRRLGTQPVTALTENSVIFSVGGAKGIGVPLLKKLSDAHRPTIYICGTSPESDPIVQKNLAFLRQGNPKIHYLSVDASRREALEPRIRELVAKHGKVDCIINGAGKERSGLLRLKGGDVIREELETKTFACRNVLEIAEACAIRRVINFSSTVPRFGNSGQTIYGFANGILDGMTREFNARNRGKGLFATISHWPAWNGVGMTENPGLLNIIRATGVALLDAPDAAELFQSEFGANPDEEVFYLPFEDIEKYEAALLEPTISPTLPFEPFNGRDSVPLAKVTRARHGYLWDHHMGDHEMYPASAALADFMALGYFRYREFPVVKNFSAKNILILNEELKDTYIQRTDIPAGGMQLRIARDITYFSADAALGTGPVLDWKKEFQPAYTVDTSSFYNPDYADFGPFFQVSRRVEVNEEKEVRSHMGDVGSLRFTGIAFFDRLSQCFEAAFQSFGISAALKGFSDTVPEFVETVTLYPGFSLDRDEFTCIPEVLHIAGDSVQGNVVVVNSRGERMIGYQGIRIKKVINAHYTLRLQRIPETV